MVLPKAQSRLATLADQSVRVDAPQGYADVAGRLGAYWSANAYWDGAAWQRHDTAIGATLLTLNPGGTYTLRTAAAGANPIAWAAATTTFFGDTGWQAPAYNANWADFGAGQAVGGYKFDALGRVVLKGLVKKAVALVANDAIFALPAGYRPTNEHIFACASAAGYTEIRAQPGGNVYIVAGGSAVFTSLAGIRFDPLT
jgi:hypothetical protein